MWRDDIATLLLTSLIVFTTIGLELTMASISVNKVVSDSSSRFILCIHIRDGSMILADLIYLSNTPPILLTILHFGGFFFYAIQSALFSSKKSPILFFTISFMHFSCSFSAPIKLLPLSLLCLAMKRRSARINELVSILLVISMWIVRLTKHVKRAPYRFKMFLLSYISNGSNMFTRQ